MRPMKFKEIDRESFDIPQLFINDRLNKKNLEILSKKAKDIYEEKGFSTSSLGSIPIFQATISNVGKSPAKSVVISASYGRQGSKGELKAIYKRQDNYNIDNWDTYDTSQQFVTYVNGKLKRGEKLTDVEMKIQKYI
jgi:hypothetical protein